jgi:tyrosine-protein kinase Etk/Wzc
MADQEKNNSPLIGKDAESGSRGDLESKQELTSFRQMFPRKEKDRDSLIKSIGLENFQESIDYNKLLGNLLRRSWIIVVCGFVFGLLGYFLLGSHFNLDKSFTATTHLLYKERKRSVGEGSYNISTIQDMILMEKTCQATKTMLDSDLSVAQIRGMSRVMVNKKSNFLTLNVTSKDAEVSKKVANTLSLMAVRMNLSFYKQKAEFLLKSLRDKGEQAKRSFHESEQKLVDFQKENKIIDIVTSKKLLLEAISAEEQNMVNMENKISSLKRDVTALEEELKITPQKIVREAQKQDFLVFELQSVQRVYIQLLSEYGVKNPKVQKLKAELERLKKAVANSASNSKDVVQEINPKVALIKERQREVKLRLNKANSFFQAMTKSIQNKYDSLAKIPALQLSFLQLLKEKETNEKQFNVYEKKANEVELQSRSPLADFEVYELASSTVPNRQIPKSVFAGSGAAAGLIISFLLILLIEVFDSRIFTRKEVDSHFNSECLLTIPVMHEAHMSMLTSPLGIYIQNLAEKLAQRIELSGPQVLAFCSTRAQEGKSSLTNELSKYYSRLGLKTVYMDFNHRSNDFFEDTMDISSFLDPEKSIEHLFSTNDNLSRAKFEYSEGMNDYLKNMNSAQLVEKLKENYDVILIDSPGILDEDYACNAISLADEVIYIIKSGLNTKKEIDHALKKLEDRGIYPAGVILNAVNKRYLES